MLNSTPTATTAPISGQTTIEDADPQRSLDYVWPSEDESGLSRLTLSAVSVTHGTGDEEARWGTEGYGPVCSTVRMGASGGPVRMAVAELCSTESEQDGFHGNGKSQPAGLFNDLSLDTPSFRSANTHFSDDLRVRPQSSDDPVLTSEVPRTQDFPWMLHARQLSRE